MKQQIGKESYPSTQQLLSSFMRDSQTDLRMENIAKLNPLTQSIDDLPKVEDMSLVSEYASQT